MERRIDGWVEVRGGWEGEEGGKERRVGGRGGWGAEEGGREEQIWRGDGAGKGVGCDECVVSAR